MDGDDAERMVCEVHEYGEMAMINQENDVAG